MASDKSHFVPVVTVLNTPFNLVVKRRAKSSYFAGYDKIVIDLLTSA